MPRPIWKGAISFGLVTVPVGVYSAVKRNDLSFRLLHGKDGSRIDYRRFCETENVEVPWKEIVRGYEYAKGEYVVLTEQDLARARVEATQTIDITDFVVADEIDWIHFESAYYLAPTKPGAKAYALLRDALAESRRVGVGTVVLRQREHLAAVRPMGDVLVLATLRFAHEIRPASGLELPTARKADARERRLALQLIDTLASEWQPDKYKDTYREVLMEVIERKRQGKRLRVAPRRPAKVVSLVQALEKSLAKPRAGAARRASSRQRRAA